MTRQGKRNCSSEDVKEKSYRKNKQKRSCKLTAKLTNTKRANLKRKNSSRRSGCFGKSKRRKADDIQQKWRTLKHRGPLFSPTYKRLPPDVTLLYKRKAIKLSRDAEEIAGHYARMHGHDFLQKPRFNENFFEDWRRAMTVRERNVIEDLKCCDFKEIKEYYELEREERKNMSARKKLKIKCQKETEATHYGVCQINGRKELVGNFRVEPPGLFRGRGDHPLMGKFKRRVLPEDVTINCSRCSIPAPPKGHKWKEVVHDKSVSWLASWKDPLQGGMKYIMLDNSSSLKTDDDKLKYDKARELGLQIRKIRKKYQNEWKSEEMTIRQRSVALYFIDRLALRAGNEKGEHKADTVGCCTLRVEHVKLRNSRGHPVVTLDFLGKDSIRFVKQFPVHQTVWNNLKLFMKRKDKHSKLFENLTSSKLNAHLNELLEGLTAKVFRTFNSSQKFENLLDTTTPEDGTTCDKILAFRRANKEIATLCNHQKTVPKNFKESIRKLNFKIKAKKSEILKKSKELKRLKKGSPQHFQKFKLIQKIKTQLNSLETTKTERIESKSVALQTSLNNYLDPRIVVAWCEYHNVPVEKVYNQSQRRKFRWAIETADEEFRFD